MPPSYHQPWTAQIFFETTDGVRTIKSAPGAGKELIITKIRMTITTSGAQSIDIESDGGAVELVKVPVSPGVGSQFVFESVVGFVLPTNVGLVATASGAANAGLIVAEGYTRGLF